MIIIIFIIHGIRFAHLVIRVYFTGLVDEVVACPRAAFHSKFINSISQVLLLTPRLMDFYANTLSVKLLVLT